MDWKNWDLEVFKSHNFPPNGCSIFCDPLVIYTFLVLRIWASLVAQAVKAPAYNAGDPGSIPGLERSSGEGNGNPLQYSYLEYPMDGGAW